jgi:hypothetical protein
MLDVGSRVRDRPHGHPGTVTAVITFPGGSAECCVTFDGAQVPTWLRGDEVTPINRHPRREAS